LLDGKTVSDERLGSDSSLGQQLEKSFHVTGFGPANVADWVVNSLLLVGRVVPSWAIRPRNPEIQFLLVEEPPLNVHAYRTNGNNYAAITGDFRGEIHQITAGGLGSYEHRVRAAAGRVPHAYFVELRGGGTRGIGTASPRQFHSFTDNIGSDYPAAGCLENLNRKLSE
jgi:hypothetical protein